MIFSNYFLKIKTFILSHSVVSFFILAYTISWISWLLFSQVNTGYINGFEIVGTLGPVLSAMVISNILKPEKTEVRFRKRMRLFLLSLLVVMVLFFLMRYWDLTGLVDMPGRPKVDSLYPTPLAIFIDLIGAAFMALVISGIYSARKGVQELLKTINFKYSKTVWYWLVVAVFLYPVVIIIGNTCSSLLGIVTSSSVVKGPWYWVALDATLMCIYGLFFGGGFEEPGWRGFALPALQKQFTPLVASIIIGPLWAFWHWPLFWIGEYGGGVFQVLFYSLATIQYSVLLTALYRWSNKSLPVIILFHSAINITSIYIPVTSVSNILWLVLSLILALWMWRKPEKFVLT